MKSILNRRLLLILGFVFIDLLGYSLILPLLPFYADTFAASLTTVGLLGTVNALAQLIAAPTIGRLSDRYGRRPLLIFSIAGTIVAFLLLGFAFNTPQEIGRGLEVILTSPANLITDYFELANVGATLVNAGAMLLFTLGVIGLSGANITGAVIAGLFTVTGFSFFGKNLLNTLPIMLGVYAYAKMLRLPLSSVIVQSLFGTSLGPLVSEICFNVGLPLLPALVLGIASGILVGLIMTPLAAHFIRFHKGYSLYNIGFTAGIIGMVFMAVLRGFGVKIETVSILSKGNTVPFAIVLYGLFAMMLILGLLLNRWRIKGLSYLFSLTGALSTDFTALAGFGATTINMSLLGMLGTTYALAVGGEINGPVIGGILTVVGFGAYGKHVRNVIPVLLGVFLVNLVNIHEANATFAILAALFGTTLAPIAGQYGVVAGVVAGALHMSLVTNISFLHAGMNLYNDGFSGGFIAAIISPLWEAFSRMRADKGKASERG